MTLTLPDFLTARYDEDVELLEREDRVFGGDGEVWTIEAHSRALADIESKRAVVEFVLGWFAEDGPNHMVLQSLALPFADHPDYRQEWKP